MYRFVSVFFVSAHIKGGVSRKYAALLMVLKTPEYLLAYHTPPPICPLCVNCPHFPAIFILLNLSLRRHLD
jgi:hypothetical protein